jgi:uncharacterized protein YjdB
VTSSPDPDYAQISIPDAGIYDIDHANSSVGWSNESDKVLKYSKPVGTWKLFGMLMPTAELQSTERYAQFQFKYLGADIEELFVQLISVDGEAYEKTIAIEGADAWRLFTMNLDIPFEFKEFKVFVNSEMNEEMSCYFDDFKLSASASEWLDNASISDPTLDLNSGEEFVLVTETHGMASTWISENSSVATVDKYGKVTALALGTTKITAVSLHGEPVECLVKVDGGEVIIIPATDISIQGGPSIELKKNDSYQLNAVISPIDATETAIVWQSDQPEIVSISESGLITALSGGSTLITANIIDNQDLSTSITIDVTVDVSGILIEGEGEFSLEQDSTLQLIAVISPEDATDKSVEWFTDASDIASVNQEGLVTSISKGTSIITARSKADPTLRASVTIIVDVTGINLNSIGSISVYPNPVKDHFILSAEKPIHRIELIGITGETVLTYSAIGTTEIVVQDLNLLPGIYVLKVKMDMGNIVVGKVVVE